MEWLTFFFGYGCGAVTTIIMVFTLAMFWAKNQTTEAIKDANAWMNQKEQEKKEEPAYHPSMNNKTKRGL